MEITKNPKTIAGESAVMEEKFNVVLCGKRSDLEVNLVAQKLAALLKCSMEQATALLSNPSFSIKKDVTQDLADRYKKAIEATGVVCLIEPVQGDGLALEFEAISAAPPAVAAISQPASRPEPVSQAHPEPEPLPPSVVAPTKALAYEATIKSFVGKNYEYYARKWAITAQQQNKRSWNWAAFCFSFGWMAYRKMYFYAWIFVGVVCVGTLLELALGLPAGVSGAINLAIAGAFGAQGNAWYQRHVDRKIREIQAMTTPDQVPVEIARQGGTNLGIAIGFFVALSFVLLLIGFIATPDMQ